MAGHFLIVEADFYKELAHAQKQGLSPPWRGQGQAMMWWLSRAHWKFRLPLPLLICRLLNMMAMWRWDALFAARQPIMKRFVMKVRAR